MELIKEMVINLINIFARKLTILLKKLNEQKKGDWVVLVWKEREGNSWNKNKNGQLPTRKWWLYIGNRAI